MSLRLRRLWAKAAHDRLIHRALNSTAGPEKESLVRLISHASRVSCLLRPLRFARQSEAFGQCAIVGGLVSLARHHRDWVRAPEAWFANDSPPMPVFASLAHHLLAVYPVPRFMTSAWLRASIIGENRVQEWFKQIGRGRSVRSLDLPIPFTRAMAHHFGLAPDHFSVDHAVRWGQVRGMGGSERLAHALISTPLGHGFEHDCFWRTVIQFFVNHPQLVPLHVSEIVEYMYHAAFDDQDCMVNESGSNTPKPRETRFCLKGRSVGSLLRHVHEWRKRMGIDDGKPGLFWSASGISSFSFAEQDERTERERVWTIRELVSSAQLRAEGAAMRHCVAGYDRLCARRWTTIWSLRVNDDRGEHRVLTIQVDARSRKVVEALRARNLAPKPKELSILRMWADQERLTIDC